MSGAPVVLLGDVTTKVGSGATPRGGEAAYKPSGIPLIRSMNVHFDGFRPDGLAFLDEEQARALKNVEVRAGDVLLNITGASIGRVTIAPPAVDGARVNQHVCIIRPDERLDSSFLRWYLASPSQQRLINGIESGATRQALTKEKILGFEVPVLPLRRQREIVAEIEKQFSRLDEAFANLKRVKANLKRYKAAVLKAAVGGRLVETEAALARRDGRSHETGEQLLTRILEARRSHWKGTGKYKEPTTPDTTDLHELPEGWAWVSFEQACFAISDEGKKLARSSYESSGALPVIDQGEEEVGGYTNNIALEFSGNLPVIAFGDHTRRFKLVRTRFVIGADGVKLIGVGPAWVPEFLWFQFQTLEFEDRGYSRHFQFVRNKPLKLPPLREQHRIVAELERRLSIMQTTAQEVASLENRAGTLRSATLEAMLCSRRALP